MPTAFYNKNANSLAEQYLSKTFTEVHQSWIEHLQPILARNNARILDLGAGAGRDSKQIAEWGRANNIQVVAVEPAHESGDTQTFI